MLFLQLFLSHYVYKKKQKLEDQKNPKRGEFVPTCPPEVTDASDAVMRGRTPGMHSTVEVQMSKAE